MNTAEELDRIAEEAWEGRAKKQSELVNMTFTLVAAQLVKYEYEGEDRTTYVATVTIDGADDDYYLGGAIVERQVKWLMDNEQLPCRVKLIRDADRKGSPYVLKSGGGEAVHHVDAPKPTVNGITDAELIRQAVAIRGIDEVALALGDLSDRIEVDESGAYTLPLKGLKLTEAAAIRTKLRELIG